MSLKKMTENSSVASETLLKAADLIEVHGLAKGKFEDADGCLCAYGAIYKAGGIDPYDGSGYTEEGSKAIYFAKERLLDYLFPKRYDPNRLSGTRNSITAWNDAPGRGTEQVAATLREAAIAVMPTEAESS